MNPADLVHLAREALLLAVATSLPVVGAVALVSLVVSVVQAATQVSDPTLSHLPRFLVGAFVLVALGPWIGSQLVAFAARAFAIAT